jgi:hypothetical protein
MTLKNKFSTLQFRADPRETFDAAAASEYANALLV